MARNTMKVEGLRELDEALGELSKGVARGVLRRALTKAAKPMEEAAKQMAPHDTGFLRDSITTTHRIKNTVGNAEYAAVMRGGGSRAEAVSALRTARRAAAGEGSFAEVHVGVANVSKRNSIKANVMEFGSYKDTPQPYMRPAFDATKMTVLGNIKGEMKTEIDKAAKRAARKAARLAAKGQ